MLTLISLITLALAQDPCTDCFSKLARSSVESASPLNQATLAREANKVLGRTLSDKETKALDQARGIGNVSAYSADEVLQQEKILIKAGFKPSEIASMRKSGLLGNWVRSSPIKNPTEIRHIQSGLHSLNRAMIDEIKKGKKFSYVVDDLGQMQIVDQAQIWDEGGVYFVKSVGPDGKEQIRRVQEAGQLQYNPVTKKIEFAPQYGFYPEMNTQYPRWVSQQDNSVSAVVKANPRLSQAQTLKCLDILQARQKGKGFVLNSLIGDNIVMTGAVLSGELMGAGRLSTKDGREVVLTDYESSNAAWIINGFLRKGMVLKNINFGSYAATRIPTNFLLIEMQREFFRSNLTNDSEKRSENIRNFNAGWMMAKLPVGYYFDRYLVNTLPAQLFSACQKGSKTLQVVFHPGVVGVYDKALSAFLYYTFRKEIISE